jgi:hypothetical protein
LEASIAAPANAQQPAAQTKPAPAAAEPAQRGPGPGQVQKVFIVKHGRVEELARILSIFPAAITSSDRSGLSVLAVSAAPAVVSAIEETIKRLDVPPPPAKSVDVTGYVLECSASGGEAGTTPAELQDVVAQLIGTLHYKSCGLGQTLFARASDRASFRAAFAAYSLAARVDVDASQSPSIVRFRSLDFQVMGSNGRFTGDVDIREGQRVVLGKVVSTAATGKDGILVLTAKVVD